MIDQHTLDRLEFTKVIALIEGKCLTPFGRTEVQAFGPMFDCPTIELRQQEISELKDILSFGLPFPLSRIEDCRNLLDKSQVEGIFLDPKEIFVVLELVELSISLHAYDKEGRPKFPAISSQLASLRPFPELVRDIKKAIDERGEIKDDASPRLRTTRAEIGDSRRRIMRQLEQTLSAQTKQPGWQDDIVTQRNGRYVIPVPANLYRADVGILHDRSQSGATFFIEPKETVEQNNRLNMLLQEERLEMDRILRALTRQIAERADRLIENVAVIGKLDSFHAAATFARLVKANRPHLVDGPVLDLIDARHPLLVAQFGTVERVVPMCLNLDDNRQAVLVTGPNTGGKTILLKTVGLLVIMAQSGLPIPADERSQVGIFRKVFADIGDEQSIELSLSTFSSHITNIISAINQVSEDSLVLFDEIGAGTDPKEGAALAEAVLLHIVHQGAKLLATTHYSQLKTLPLEHPAIENASLEFDRETLAPTYRLKVGLPGSSYAVEIAGRLGMPDSVCGHASRLLGSGERSLADLISSVEAQLTRIRTDQAELSERLARSKASEEEYKQKLASFVKNVDEEKHKALEETANLLDSTRKETERLVAEIRASQASKESIKQIQKKLKETGATVSEIKAKQETERLRSIDAIRFLKGDAVRIVTLNKEGQIEALVGSERAKVKVGNVMTVVELRNLRHIDAPTSVPKPRSVAGQNVEEVLSPEIHLRGMTAEEGKEALERFLDKAIVAGLKQVYVIHGKGTGALRRAMTEYLREHKEVATIRLGDWNEGGAGVTIVELKQ